jgi:small subunit ribosomal protein S17
MTDTTDKEVLAPGEGSASDEPEAPRGQSGAETERAARKVRKVREGTVVSNAMDKTVVVAVVDRVRHAKYNKFIMRTKKLYVHDETNDANVGDKVRVMETRPLSKNKRSRITDILERAK